MLKSNLVFAPELLILQYSRGFSETSTNDIVVNLKNHPINSNQYLLFMHACDDYQVSPFARQTPGGMTFETFHLFCVGGMRACDVKHYQQCVLRILGKYETFLTPGQSVLCRRSLWA